jgi:hypothetical protein
MSMDVDGEGNIELSIGHFSWGYEVLMARWLDDAGLLNHQTYFEDFSLTTSLTADMATTFSMDTVCQFSMFAVKANESSGDDAAWVWQSARIDYVTAAGHPSEYEPYELLKYKSWNSGDALFGQSVMYDTTPGVFELGEGETFIIEMIPPDVTDVIGYRGAPTANGDDDYAALAGGDTSAFDALQVTGKMELGFWITNPDGGADLDSMWDPVTNVITIQGPQTFDNVRHTPDGPLYHGAPWIEFDIVTTKAAASSEPVTEVVSETSTGASSAAELSALMTVVALSFLVIVALGYSIMRRPNRQ